MSLSDGFKANHGENGFLGVVEDGYGVYYRELPNEETLSLRIIHPAGDIIEKKDVSSLEEGIHYIAETYGWDEMEDEANQVIVA